MDKQISFVILALLMVALARITQEFFSDFGTLDPSVVKNFHCIGRGRSFVELSYG